MPRKKETVAQAVAVEPRSKRQIKPVENTDFVYESPVATKKPRKVEEKYENAVIPKKVEEKKIVEKKPAVAEKQEEDEVDPLFLEPFKFGWKREVVRSFCLIYWLGEI